MLYIDTPEIEIFDESTNMFGIIKPQHLQMEHSLLSLSKWEARWRISFLSTKDKTEAQMLDYIYCMTINKNIDKRVFHALPKDCINRITHYIETPQTATTFRSDNQPFGKKGQRPVRQQIITAELIYWQMIVNGIPFSCEKWHLSRLLTLIRVCDIKNSTNKPNMTKAELIRRNAELNARRLKQSH